MFQPQRNYRVANTFNLSLRNKNVVVYLYMITDYITSVEHNFRNKLCIFEYNKK
jgi:hypothetical protein